MRASWATLTLAVTVHSVPLSQPHARRTRGAPDDSEAEVAGMSGSCGQRTRDSHGNMRAKLSDYIGQVFECKADSPLIHAGSSPTGSSECIGCKEHDSRNVQSPAPRCRGIQASLARPT